MKNSFEVLKSLGFPTDDSTWKESSLTFEDGSHYGVELSSINNLQILDTVVRLARREKVRINRVDECRGISRLPKEEVRGMVELCAEERIQLVMSTGPRAIYDNGGFVRSKNGARVGYRLRGMDNLGYALDDIFLAIDLGVRAFLIYDEGLLDVLNQLRLSKALPQDTKFKLSVHCGCANPASARLMERLGADSINLIPDLETTMFSSVRASVKCTLDIFSDTASEAGGLILTHRIPEIIRACAPVFIKCGAVSQVSQNHLPSEAELTERVKQLVCVTEMIERSQFQLKQLGG